MFDYRTLMNKTCFEPFSSSFHPDWRESGVQLTEKQVVLLMHDIYVALHGPPGESGRPNVYLCVP